MSYLFLYILESSVWLWATYAIILVGTIKALHSRSRSLKNVLITNLALCVTSGSIVFMQHNFDKVIFILGLVFGFIFLRLQQVSVDNGQISYKGTRIPLLVLFLTLALFIYALMTLCYCCTISLPRIIIPSFMLGVFAMQILYFLYYYIQQKNNKNI